MKLGTTCTLFFIFIKLSTTENSYEDDDDDEYDEDSYKVPSCCDDTECPSVNIWAHGNSTHIGLTCMGCSTSNNDSVIWSINGTEESFPDTVYDMDLMGNGTVSKMMMIYLDKVAYANTNITCTIITNSSSAKESVYIDELIDIYNKGIENITNSDVY
nr:CPPV292 putative interleukin binding protein [Cooks petrelpox virus]